MMKTQEQIKSDAVVWFSLVEALQAFIVLRNIGPDTGHDNSHWINRTIAKLQDKLYELINEAPELLGEVAEDSDVEFYKSTGSEITEEEIEMYKANGYADIEGNIRIYYGETYERELKT